MSNTKVYAPRGARGGGGLIAQTTIPQADLDEWVTPSATARLAVERRLDQALRGLKQAVLAAFAEEEARRRSVEEGGREAGAAHEGSRAMGGPAEAPGGASGAGGRGVRADLRAEEAVRRGDSTATTPPATPTTPVPPQDPGVSETNEGSTSAS